MKEGITVRKLLEERMKRKRRQDKTENVSKKENNVHLSLHMLLFAIVLFAYMYNMYTHLSLLINSA